MIRLAISVEGQTEDEFAKDVLATHLRTHGIEVQPVLIGRARGSGIGGGDVTVGRLSSEMAHLYRSFDAVTSLVDFYGFRDKGERTAGELEALVRRKIRQMVDGDENRVSPYVQMHEFEGLLFSDVGAFSTLLRAPPETVDALRDIRSGFATPEDINNHRTTAPSRRLNAVLTGYRKRLHGPLVAMEIGLDAIRRECPRFHAWMERLESLRDRIRS